MRLTKKQENILIGLILGDGCLEKNGNNVRLRIEHCIKQEKYFQWLFSQLSNLACKPRIVISKHNKNGKMYKKWHFSTLSLEILNKYYTIFYKNSIKIIPKDISKILIKPLSLAIWFMDDGYKRNDCNALRISTDSFNYEEQMLIVRCLRQNFNIKSKLHKKANTWNVYIRSKDAKQFCDLVRPYIIATMNYKLI